MTEDKFLRFAMKNWHQSFYFPLLFHHIVEFLHFYFTICCDIQTVRASVCVSESVHYDNL